MKLIAPPPPPLFPPWRDDRRGGSSIGERSRPKIYFTGPRPAKLASFSSQRIISRLAKYLVADVKPQLPLEIAGIRGAVPLTFELHEYSRPKRSSREGPYVYTLGRIYILAFFSVFFSLPFFSSLLPVSCPRVNFHDSFALGPKLEFPKFDGPSIW